MTRAIVKTFPSQLDTLYIDSTNKRIGIGVTVPTGAVHAYCVTGESLVIEKSNNQPYVKFAGPSGQNVYLRTVAGVLMTTMNDGLTSVIAVDTINRNFGIGVASPATRLDVQTTSGDCTARIASAAGSRAVLALGYSTTDTWLFDCRGDVSDKMYITAPPYNSGSPVMTLVANGGKVGIGTTSPAAIEGNLLTIAANRPRLVLSHNGSYEAGSYVMFQTGPTANYYGWYTGIYSGNQLCFGITSTLGGLTPQAPLVSLNYNGAVSIGGGKLTPSSLMGVYTRLGVDSVNHSSSQGSSLGTLYTESASAVDTNISVNMASCGCALLLLASRNTGGGTSADSALYIIRFYYDGNNTPTKHYIGGSLDFVTIGKSGSNTLTLTNASGGNVQYAWYATK